MRNLIFVLLCGVCLYSCIFSSNKKGGDAATTEGPKAPDKKGLSLPMKKDSTKRGTLQPVHTGKVMTATTIAKPSPNLDTISVH